MRKTWPRLALSSVAIAAASAVWAADTTADSRNDPGVAPNSPSANEDRDSSNTGPSPNDHPSPGLRLDERMRRAPPQPGDTLNGPQSQAPQNGDDESTATPHGKVQPQNPADPATPVFPANPPPPADPGQPGNPVTPTAMRFA